MKWTANLFQLECNLFQLINRHYDHKAWNSFFHFITHAGGARFTIGFTIILFLLFHYYPSHLGLQMVISLALSHVPVMIIKRFYPRKRPYLVLTESKVTSNPLKDFSFPSGHTTAIVSIVTPIVCHAPVLGFLLIPLALLVGISRIFLGLHYPSDVLCGIFLGSSIGFVSFISF